MAVDCRLVYIKRKKWRTLSMLMILTSIISGLVYHASDLSSSNVFSNDCSECEQPILIPGRHLLAEHNVSNVTKKDPLFPDDLFTEYQRHRGALLLHVTGMIYMFVALAITCDEFFVPSLDVIIEKLNIAEDVAGATFMAAGGSAPELFTSVIGVFVSFNDVGIGTIVGSAVFNILFVIGMCAIFSREVLTLTWWPLFRDCIFYLIALGTLIAFFLDNRIQLWEAGILLGVYAAYVIFMIFNQQAENFVKRQLNRNKVTKVASTDQLVENGKIVKGKTPTMKYYSSSKFRQGLLQLMIHSIDPMMEGKVDERATQLQAIATKSIADKDSKTPGTYNKQSGLTVSEETQFSQLESITSEILTKAYEASVQDFSGAASQISEPNNGMNIEEPASTPLDMSWPTGWKKQTIYIMVFPITFLLWITLPDPRSKRGKKFFPITFLGSIIWIAVFSYLMVWWATVAGDTVGIPNEVMGLTFLAAGTSIPDLITSVIVARKGFGDMAVSSSVGSNIFDVTVGLPLPWFIYGCIHWGKAVVVESKGLVCSVMILLLMLLFVFLSIVLFKWKMNKGLGFTMFVLYFVFVVISLLFEFKIAKCPVG